jgi:predicted nuclease of predicted toxin-antitoxin system
VWLLDANIDIRICDVLFEFGIDCRTAESLGWKELSNGRLVSAAVANNFTCLLTRDGLFAESATRALNRFPDFAVVVIVLKQRKRAEYLARFREAFVQRAIVPEPGTTIIWP